MKTVTRLAPILGTVAFVLLFACYYFSLPLNDEIELDSASIAVEQGKILWGSSSLLLNLSMAWSLAVGYGVVVGGLRRLRQDKRGRWLAAILGGVAGLALAVTVWEVSGSGGRLLLERVMEAVPAVDHILRINNVLAALAIVTVLSAVYLVGHDSERCSVAELSNKVSRFRLLLYSAAALLGAGVYEIYRLYEWGALLYGAGEQKEWIMGFASSLAIGGGIVFSALLVLMFLPPALLLNRALEMRVSDAAKQDKTFNRERWLIQERLEGSPLKAVGSYVAVLLPALTGFITNLTGAAFGAAG